MPALWLPGAGALAYAAIGFAHPDVLESSPIPMLLVPVSAMASFEGCLKAVPMTGLSSSPPDSDAILLFPSECGSAVETARGNGPSTAIPAAPGTSHSVDEAVRAVVEDISALRAELGQVRELAARMADDSQHAFESLREARAECGRLLAAATDVEKRLLVPQPTAAVAPGVIVARTRSWSVRYGHFVLLGLVISAALMLMRASHDGGPGGTVRPLPSRPISLALSAGTLRGAAADVFPRKATLEAASGVRQFIGTLIVRSEPTGATVFIDRRAAGETPLRIASLPARSHTVWVEREGHERWTAAVLVPADSLTRVDAKLRRAPTFFEGGRLPSDRTSVGQRPSNSSATLSGPATPAGRKSESQ